MHVRTVVATLVGTVLALGCGNTSTSDDAGVIKLSQAGESCARSADCAGDLICVNLQCVAAGTTAPVARLSSRGEECTKTADCTSGLVCWLVSNGSPLFTGMCDYENFGVTPTGKTCSAECLAASDCLELPIPDQAATGQPLYRSCQDLSKALSGITCNGTSGMQRECFLYNTYCASGSNPWACTNGACQYTGSCAAGKSGEVVGGCPAFTRSGTSLLVSACNATSLTCVAPPPTGCKVDTDCDSKPVTDDAADTCSTGECVCNAASGGCFRRCRNDLECAHGYVCGSSQMCVPGPTCATDAMCVATSKFTNAKCVQGACQLPCANDLECNYPADFVEGSPANVNLVCHAGTCQAIGCSSNTECSVTSGGKGVNMFCATPPAASTTVTPVSAITN
jgi:hypothetical protein